MAALRLICRQTLCPSCYNRQREVLIGANAKGAQPKLAAERLHRAVLLLDGAGAPKTFELDFCSGRREAELIVQRWWPGARLVDYKMGKRE
jgi:hypothetical protein